MGLCWAAGSGEGSSASGAQRERLLSATERVRATGDRIVQGKQTLLETEELGVSILQDLHKQRETIMHARNHVRNSLAPPSCPGSCRTAHRMLKRRTRLSSQLL